MLEGFWLMAQLSVCGSGPNIPPCEIIGLESREAPCDPAGLVLKLDAGGSITGPFSLTNMTGYSRAPDGSTHADTEDTLSVPEGQKLTGPILLCSRLKK